MSYDISLNDPVTGEVIVLDAPHHMRGGSYQMGGCVEMWLNITYNYSSFYHKAFGENGIRTIYGKTGAASIPVLTAAIAHLGDECDADYWKATDGNAKKPLHQLLAFAQMRPDGIWDGD